jgi:hypothetical protein
VALREITPIELTRDAGERNKLRSPAFLASNISAANVAILPLSHPELISPSTQFLGIHPSEEMPCQAERREAFCCASLGSVEIAQLNTNIIPYKNASIAHPSAIPSTLDPLSPPA